MSNSSDISYADHRALVVPEPTQEMFHYTNLSFPRLHTGNYRRGSSLNQNSSFQIPITCLEFHIRNVQTTGVQGLIRIKGYMVFHRENSYYSSGMYYDQNLEDSQPRDPIRFSLHGFWSESSGKLCMVGSSYDRIKRGNSLNLPAVFKLYNVKKSTSVGGLITGALQSLLSSENGPKFFEPISIMMFPRMNYEYSLILKKKYLVLVKMLMFLWACLLLLFQEIISVPCVNVFNLRYASHCGFAKNCTPFVWDFDYLPGIVSLNEIECSEDKQKLRATIKFRLSRYEEEAFYPNTTFVGEGLWNSKNNHLFIVACRFLNVSENSFANVHVGDCSTRLSLRYPSIWTIGNMKSIVGDIWSNKGLTEFGYFDKIRIESSFQDLPIGVLGLKYEYTKIDKARKVCTRKKSSTKKGAIYPNVFSQEMRFDISFTSAKTITGWGTSSFLSWKPDFL